ncbi:ABC-2 type transport system ATP-binding protein [Thermoactinomyces sp. DSM 45891]|uniref:ABC transporter ATP-binding protein n=1 Tax=Thermoactinomyces sp. DSM 45891 TaxID=1761907 RepID=UPI00090F72A7|nr:ABC transporter ATP-binding protein [Thermoactinomyces sp. DSM 45891]SFX21471.1 ABC-2 type transport system ATP-binding protein [Thermoactinomyces sp. DSM 45891]
MEVLAVNNLAKKIGDKTIVSQIQMRVNQGEVYGFLGPNGAGKTTTIRMIVGLIKPTKGSVRICGHDIETDREEAMKSVGAIVENPETYSYLSGYKNLIHYARLAGIPNKEKRIKEVVTFVKLTDRIHDKVKTYSLGMRQRLGLAQALLGKPKLLILDEPTNGLDPEGIREFRGLVRQLADQGTAVFVSSHILKEMEAICDRIAIIKNGRIVTEQNVAKVLEGQGQKVRIKVDKIKKVEAFLQQNEISYQVIDHNTMDIPIAESEVSEFVRFLSMHNVNLRSIETVKDSLEELFFNFTADEEGEKKNA